MNYTNRYNLPQAVYNAVTRDTYIRGDNNYSVTELIESPRIVQLKRRHWDELEEDALDSVWSIFGSAVHHIMETHASDDDFVEQRYYIHRLGRKVGGMIDAHNNGVISDYKVTSAWSIVYGSKKDHWTHQLNLYAHCLRENGIEVKGLQIVAFLRDWDRNKAKQDFTYPQTPLLVIPIDLWTPEHAEAYLMSRLEKHIEAEEKSDEELTFCLPDECWEQPTKYAVIKDGNKKATKVFADKVEAETFADTDAKFTIITRVGKRNRCSDYCSLALHCNQYRDYVAGFEE